MKKIFVTLILGLLMSISAMGMTINNVNLKENITQNNTQLELNGAGIRTKYFLKLYVGALYLPTKTTNPKEIIESKDEMSIKLFITSKMITTDRLKEALTEGFETVEPSKLAKIEDKVKRFDAAFTDKVELGDVYSFDSKDGVVYVSRNGKPLITIEGQDFKEALYGIWLGENAIDSKLKAKMLGK